MKDIKSMQHDHILNNACLAKRKIANKRTSSFGIFSQKSRGGAKHLQTQTDTNLTWPYYVNSLLITVNIPSSSSDGSLISTDLDLAARKALGILHKTLSLFSRCCASAVDTTRISMPPGSESRSAESRI